MTGKARYFGCCVGWPKRHAEDLAQLMESARIVSPQTFMSATDSADRSGLYERLGFTRTKTALREHAAGFLEFRSGRLFGRRALVMTFSRIDYVFVEPETGAGS